MKQVTILLLALGVLVGCSTMKGLGEDIQKGGHAIEKAATK
jgi:predicted small secreted protein